MIKGYCPKCLTVKSLKEHFVFPPKHFSQDAYNDERVMLLCETCKKEIEGMIPDRQLPKDSYLSINMAWMRGEAVVVV